MGGRPRRFMLLDFGCRLDFQRPHMEYVGGTALLFIAEPLCRDRFVLLVVQSTDDFRPFSDHPNRTSIPPFFRKRLPLFYLASDRVYRGRLRDDVEVFR